MTVVANILGKLIEDHFLLAQSEGLESRLLVPAPTEAVGQDLQELLQTQLPPKVTSLLFVNSKKSKPNEKRGWILAAGVTSKRIGSLAIISQPGQLSRIHESVVGSGGTVRQSFQDEWPWFRGDESNAFSFTEIFLPMIVKSWTDNQTDQAWISRFMQKMIHY